MNVFNVDFYGCFLSRDVDTSLHSLQEEFLHCPVNFSTYEKTCIVCTSYIISEISKSDFETLRNNYLNIKSEEELELL